MVLYHGGYIRQGSTPAPSYTVLEGIPSEQTAREIAAAFHSAHAGHLEPLTSFLTLAPIARMAVIGPIVRTRDQDRGSVAESSPGAAGEHAAGARSRCEVCRCASVIASPPSASITAKSAVIRTGSWPVPRGRSGRPNAVESASVNSVACARSASNRAPARPTTPHRQRRNGAWDANRYPARRKCLPHGPTEPSTKFHHPSSEGTFALPQRSRPRTQ